MAAHLKLHPFTGTTDHDFTGLQTGQIIKYNGINIESSDNVSSFSASTFSGGTILSGSTDLYDIFLTETTSADLFSASTGTGSIIANNGTGNLASNTNSFAGGLSSTASGIYSSFSFGYHNIASGTNSATIGGGYNVASNYHSFIGGGYQNTASEYYSAIVGGQSNTASGTHSGIVGGQNNKTNGIQSVIVGGNLNSATTTSSAVIGGTSNIASGLRSVVIGGDENQVSNLRSVIIGGTGNKITSIQSVIIGGTSLINNVNNSVMVPHLTVDGDFSGGTGGGVLYSGGTDLYSIFQQAGTDSDNTAVQGGTNISTGGTASVPVMNLDSDIVLTSVNATTISGDTIYSGSTDLSDLFSLAVNGSGTDNVVPLWNGTTALDDSILSQAGSTMTATGDMIVTGDFTVNGTTTTIDSQTLQTADNNIEMNLSGNNTSATGGGITVLSGVSNSTDSIWAIDATGNWEANAGIKGTTVTATEFFAMTPYTGAAPSASDNDAWFHSGVTGTITLNYRVGGTDFSVEMV